MRDLELKSHMELVQRVKAAQVTLKIPDATTDQKNAKLTAIVRQKQLLFNCKRAPRSAAS